MSDEGNTEFVLPIMCPHCNKELNLAMIFALLAPEKAVSPLRPDEEEPEDEEDGDENQDDIPQADNS